MRAAAARMSTGAAIRVPRASCPTPQPKVRFARGAVRSSLARVCAHVSGAEGEALRVGEADGQRVLVHAVAVVGRAQHRHAVVHPERVGHHQLRKRNGAMGRR
jgi:hypothetical protein